MKTNQDLNERCATMLPKYRRLCGERLGDHSGFTENCPHPRRKEIGAPLFLETTFTPANPPEELATLYYKRNQAAYAIVGIARASGCLKFSVLGLEALAKFEAADAAVKTFLSEPAVVSPAPAYDWRLREMLRF
jgi:hypothetical protein